MKVLFISWELDPFFKFGGLGDIARSLPTALKKKGVDIRNIIPLYKALKLGRNRKSRVAKFSLLYGGKREKVEIYEVEHPRSKIPVYLVSNKHYLEIAKGFDTFAFFDKAVVESCRGNHLKWQPEIIHCNDHHAGLVPLLVKEARLPVKTILTIHNLGYQGRATLEILEKLGIEKSRCQPLRWEIKARQINFLMEGIIHADLVTTVSPTYARQIMTEEFGSGLEEILRGREGKVFGILNGIDTDYQNSVNSRSVKFAYHLGENTKDEKSSRKIYPWEEGKRLNKIYLQRKLGLKVTNSLPLLSFIGRLVREQKGIDILHKMIRRTDVTEFEFIILGTGDSEWEERYQWLSKFYPKNVSCNFEFDDVLARQIYAASDFILIPSKYEPCGLIQMLAMSFGTLPIARKTGGLADSIKDGVNGFLFNTYSSESLERSLKSALDIWRNDRPRYKMMVEAAIRADFSWDKSAEEYLNLYEKLVNNTI